MRNKLSEPKLILPDHLTLREKILFGLLAIGALVEAEIAKATPPRTINFVLSSLETQDYIQKKRTSIQSTVSYLLTKKLIKALGRKRNLEYHLTEEGLEYLFARFPALRYRNQPWDGYWRVVIYDIPEKENALRDRLRRELKYLGFKFMQKSVWATAAPVEKELEIFLKKEHLWGKILVLKSLLSDEENIRLSKVLSFPTPTLPTSQ